MGYCLASLIIFALVSSATCQLNKKDVLFLAVDDLRTELGTYGRTEVKTPNLDSLASMSMVFERAYCQVAVCSPSRTSLLTSRRPDTNHVWEINPNEYWRTFTNATTIPQYFKENGYVAAGMGKIFHPGKPNGNDDEKYSWSLPYFHGHNNVTIDHVAWHSFENTPDNMLRDGQIADKAVATLKEIKQNRTNGDNTPFFVAAGFHKPHLPLYAPSRYYDMYPPVEQIKPPANPDAPKDMPPIAWSTSRELREYKDMLKYNLSECYLDADAAMHGDNCKITGLEAQTIRRAYYACVSFTDAQIGRVLDTLKELGLSDNTIIVLWADHGWKIGELNMWGKFTNLEDDTNVPFMIRVPGMTDSGMRTKAIVELIDIFPTLTELAGLEVPVVCPEENNKLLACTEGTSLVPLLKNPDMEWKKPAFSQYARPQYAGLFKIPGHPIFTDPHYGEDVMGYSIRIDQYRFVEWYSFNNTSGLPDFSSVWGTELYDHTTPSEFFNNENVNMANDPDKQSMVTELRQMLRAGWRPHVKKD